MVYLLQMVIFYGYVTMLVITRWYIQFFLEVVPKRNDVRPKIVEKVALKKYHFLHLYIFFERII